LPRFVQKLASSHFVGIGLGLHDVRSAFSVEIPAVVLASAATAATLAKAFGTYQPPNMVLPTHPYKSRSVVLENE
jgi:hypothetical protein